MRPIVISSRPFVAYANNSRGVVYLQSVTVLVEMFSPRGCCEIWVTLFAPIGYGWDIGATPVSSAYSIQEKTWILSLLKLSANFSTNGVNHFAAPHNKSLDASGG